MFKLGLVILVSTFWKINRYISMRHLFSLFIILFLLSCNSQKTVQLANGEFVSEKQYNKMIKKSYKKVLRQMSKEDRELIKSTNFSIETELNH